MREEKDERVEGLSKHALIAVMEMFKKVGRKRDKSERRFEIKRNRVIIRNEKERSDSSNVE